MAGLESLLANNTLAQIVVYNIIGQLLAPMLAPYSQALANDANASSPQVPLSPADAALAVVRNLRSLADASAQAAKSGVGAEDFTTLVGMTGDGPAPYQLAEALRRGLIDETTYERGIRESRLRDEWQQLIKQLAVSIPSPTLALEARLKGQIDDGTSRTLYEKFGADPAYWQLAFDTEGSGPSPVEAGVLANRGIIPWDGTGAGTTSWAQSFLETSYRNKWSGPMRALAVYIPPPRTVTAMFKEGALSLDQATKLLLDSGISAELAAAYLHAGSTTKTGKTRELAQTTIEALYRDQLVDAPTAGTMLAALNYTPDEAHLILEVEDLRLQESMVRTAVSRIHSLYTAHKITRALAGSSLAALKLPASGLDNIFTLWDAERDANHKVLTAAEISGAFFHKIMSQGEAQTALVQLGYTPFEGWLILSVRNKAALPGRPSPDSIADAAGG